MSAPLGFKLTSPNDRSAIKQVDLKRLMGKYDVTPQAVIKQPLEEVARQQGYNIDRGVDDLDEYEGVGLSLGGAFPFAIMHYKGHPDGTFTIYMPRQVRDVDEITRYVTRITRFFQLPDQALQWQRKDDREF